MWFFKWKPFFLDTKGPLSSLEATTRKVRHRLEQQHSREQATASVQRISTGSVLRRQWGSGVLRRESVVKLGCSGQKVWKCKMFSRAYTTTFSTKPMGKGVLGIRNKLCGLSQILLNVDQSEYLGERACWAICVIWYTRDNPSAKIFSILKRLSIWDIQLLSSSRLLFFSSVVF